VLPSFRRLVALLIALVLFAPGSAFSRVLYACSMSGKISAGACCCHKAKLAKAHAERKQSVEKAAAEPVRVERPDCCEALEQQRATAVAAHAGSEAHQVLAAAPSATLPAIEPRAAARDVMRPLARTARGPPPTCPVYVSNCSLLI
jgi:hypothetical protein